MVSTVLSFPEEYREYQTLINVDETVGDDELVPGADIVSIHTPGHAPGSVCFARYEENAVFTGDHVLKHVSPNPLLTLKPNSDTNRTRSLPTYLNSLRKLRDEDVSIGYGGHSDRILALDDCINEIITHHQSRRDNIRVYYGNTVR